MTPRLGKAALLLGPAPESARAALEGLGLPVITVPREKNGLALGAILSLAPGLAPAEVAESAVFLHGLGPRELDAALEALRSAGYTGMKAVSTAHNLTWTPAQLVSELARERSALKKGRRRH